MVAPDPEQFPVTGRSLAAGAFLPIWFARWAIMVFNSLTTLKHRVTQAWENAIEQRLPSYLIPTLMRTTQALADHDKALQSRLATLRADVEQFSDTSATATLPIRRSIVED